MIGTEGRQQIVMRIISMLDVKFENEQSGNLAITEFKSFIRDYNLTPSEIYEAYRMAIKELLFDEKENRIDVYPNLSLITAGKVLNAYLRFKNESRQYEIGRDKLKAYLNPPPSEPTEEEKEAQAERLTKEVMECLKEHGECEYAFLVYDRLKRENDFKQFRKDFPKFYDEEFTRFVRSQKTAKRPFHSKHDLQRMEKEHISIMERMGREKIKPSEMNGFAYQAAKNRIIKNYCEWLTKN